MRLNRFFSLYFLKTLAAAADKKVLINFQPRLGCHTLEILATILMRFNTNVASEKQEKELKKIKMILDQSEPFDPACDFPLLSFQLNYLSISRRTAFYVE